jgi:uncharacterized cupin superfamily protein
MIKIVNEIAVPKESRCSPKGSYAVTRQHLSLSLGGMKDVGEWGGGHPFDVELVRLSPGKKNYPLHSHAAQTEYYIILEGTGSILDAEGKCTTLKAKDHLICPPGETHQIVNDGCSDLVYYVIANHHRADVTTYPNSGKRQIKPEYRYFKPSDVDYYEGEE